MNTKKLTIALTGAAAVAVLAAGGAVAYAAIPAAATSTPVSLNGATGDLKIARECLQHAQNVPDPSGWRPGAKIQIDAGHGFLVIRDDKNAAVCVIENGHGTGLMGGLITNHGYDRLTAARPFDYLTSMNYEHESVHFGIAADDVTGVSLIGPDKSVTGGVLKDGTFLARTPFAEDSNQSTTNHVRVTLSNGTTVDGPFRG